MKTNKTKNRPLYTNKHKITFIRHEPSYKQLELKTNLTSFLCGNRNGYRNTKLKRCTIGPKKTKKHICVNKQINNRILLIWMKYKSNRKIKPISLFFKNILDQHLNFHLISYQVIFQTCLFTVILDMVIIRYTFMNRITCAKSSVLPKLESFTKCSAASIFVQILIIHI